MAKAKNEISKVTNELATVPEFMLDDRGAGTELVKQFIQPPRLKVIQPLTKPPLSEIFAPGDLVLLPNNQLIAGLEQDDDGRRLKKSELISFVPIFFFPEWLLYNPQEIKETHGSIRERTFDPESALAAKARNPKTRYEPCPDKPDKQMSYVEVLNYAIVILRDDVASDAAVIQFKSAEHSAGTAFNTLIKSRKAPLYGCVFDMQVAFRSNAKGQWFGVDVMNPQKGPWVDNPELYAAFKEAHEEFKSFHETNSIVIEDDDVVEGGGGNASAEF